MLTFIKIAWRNLWRNKRRTALTIASVFFALFLAILMRSMQYGTYDLMKQDAIRNSSGFIQIHAPGYWEDKTIDNTFEHTPELMRKVSSVENVSMIIPRLESFALASSGIITKGIAVIGTIPETEAEITKLNTRIVDGEYFTKPDDDGVLIAEDLAAYLEVSVNDTIILLSQGYHGVSAADKFPVKGILHFPSPEMNKILIYMTLQQAQYFYSAPDRLTSYSIMLHDADNLTTTTTQINAQSGNDYEVMNWTEMMIELKQQIDSDNISGLFMLAIFYVIVAFGIFGTILMMTHERKKEFSVMIAVGMKRFKLSFIVFLETLFMGFIGIVAGIAGSIPVVLYFYKNPIPLAGEMAAAMEEFNVQPIIPFAFDFQIFFAQSLVVLLLTVCITIYPMFKLSRFNLINGLKS